MGRGHDDAGDPIGAEGVDAEQRDEGRVDAAGEGDADMAEAVLLDVVAQPEDEGAVDLRDIVEREGLRLALDALVPLAHWVTPPMDVRQFDTRFFVTRVPAHQTPAHDETETTDSVWITAPEAIARCRADELILPPPTWTTLREIEPFRTVNEVLAWAGASVLSRLSSAASSRTAMQLNGSPNSRSMRAPGAGIEMKRTRLNSGIVMGSTV